MFLCVRLGTLEMLQQLQALRQEIGAKLPLVPDLTPAFWPWKARVARSRGVAQTPPELGQTATQVWGKFAGKKSLLPFAMPFWDLFKCF